uniref:Uncharacterized protein n=1 Tax=Vespula pensylvanica TaxID=30213 RepID=A0A834NRX3_VESPE|nr:hypothetical protein H0235_011372 [Vespula pensylvanica]
MKDSLTMERARSNESWKGRIEVRDIMFSQTGRTNGKWTAVSFTLRDKYEPVAGVRRTAAIIPRTLNDKKRVEEAELGQQP